MSGQAAAQNGAVADAKPRAWRAHPGPQQALVSCRIEDIFFGGARGGGKGLVQTTRVLTPMGWRLGWELRPGDAIVDPTTGGTQSVVAVYERGEQSVYRVTCDDGATTVVDADHLWAFRVSNRRRPRSKRSKQKAFAVRELAASPQPSGRFDTLRVDTTMALIAALGASATKRTRPCIPLTEPVLFQRNGRTGTGGLAAYVLGLLLGDGSMGNLNICATDDEIRQCLQTAGFVPSGTARHTDGKPIDFRPLPAVRKGIDQWARNHGLRAARSWEKFIPSYVFTAPITYRLDFLRGLMDTDGTVDERGRCYFVSTSERLARGVCDLVRGLGGKASIRGPITKTYRYKGKRRNGRPAWQVRTWLRRNSALFRLSRKKKRCTDSWNGGAELMRAVVSVEPLGREQTRCIRVSSPHGLYVTDDYIVTHNTDGLLGDFAAHAERYGRHVHGGLFRRNFTEFQRIIERSREIFGALGWRYNESKHAWRTRRGGQLALLYLENDKDVERYKGWDFTWIGIDELTDWPALKPADKLRACLRSAHGIPCYFRATGNPGGVGHNEVYDRYITPAPPMMPFFVPNVNGPGGTWRVFIPSRLEDNPSLYSTDYWNRVEASVGYDEQLLRAWRWGDWDIVAGTMFDDLWAICDPLIPPFTIPNSWTIDRAFDWGSSRPFAVLWFATSDGTPATIRGRERTFPAGTLFVIAEDYGWNGQANEGLRLPSVEIARRVLQAEKDMGIADRVQIGPADSQIYDDSLNGTSIADDMARVGLLWVPSSKGPGSRRQGWQLIRQRFAAHTDLALGHRRRRSVPMEEPGLFIFETCTNLRRTLPKLARHARKLDDIDDRQEDHLADALRYKLQTPVGVSGEEEFVVG